MTDSTVALVLVRHGLTVAAGDWRLSEQGTLAWGRPHLLMRSLSRIETKHHLQNRNIDKFLFLFLFFSEK